MRYLIPLLILSMLSCGGGGGSSASTSDPGPVVADAFDLTHYLDGCWPAVMVATGESHGVYWATSPNACFHSGPTRVGSNVTSGSQAPIIWDSDMEAYEGWGLRVTDSDGDASWDYYDRVRVYETATGLRVEYQFTQVHEGEDPSDPEVSRWYIPGGSGGGAIALAVDAPPA